MNNPQKKAFVVGWPISHSLSPTLHSYWINEAGISASYERLAISPLEFPGFLREFANSDFVGGNITIPHKETAAELVENKTGIVSLLGAANTIWKTKGQVHCDNTDGYGFTSNLDEFAPNWSSGKTAIVLGAGGAAKAILNALVQSNFEKIYIINRTSARAKNLAQQFGKLCSFATYEQVPFLLAETDLLVNTTSLGMRGQPELNIDLKRINKNAVVTDIVYNPLRTKLLLQASALGIRTVDGIGMLLHQAVPGFERWFGIRPTVSAQLRKTIISKLGNDST